METHSSNPFPGAKSVPSTLTELAIRTAELPPSGTAPSGMRAQKLRLPHQRQGHEILYRACRERPPPDDRPISDPVARGGASRRKARARRKDPRQETAEHDRLLAAVEEFLEHSEEKNRPGTVSEYKRLLTTHFPFGTTRLADITSEQIEKRLKPLGNRPSEQQHAFTAIKVFFNWAQKRRYVQSNPCASLFSREVGKPIARSLRQRIANGTQDRPAPRSARTERSSSS